jgi:hypothetical protein
LQYDGEKIMAKAYHDLAVVGLCEKSKKWQKIE